MGELILLQREEAAPSKETAPLGNNVVEILAPPSPGGDAA